MLSRLLKIVFFSLAFSAPAWTQDKTPYKEVVAEADRYFEEEQYSLAIELYTKALSFNIPEPAIDYKLAECYRHVFNYMEAEAYYLKVFYTGQTMFPLSLYYYALMLKSNGNLAEAIQRFDQFIIFHERNATLSDFVEQAVIEKAGCEMAKHELGLPARIAPSLASGELNTIYNDFAPAFRNAESLVITSSRVASNRTLIDERYGEAFTDNYLFERGPKGWQKKIHQFYVTNSPYNDGTGSFTRNGDQYFFAVCKEKCRIYETHLLNNKWTKPAILNEMINHPEGESRQPAISPHGDTLYFSSNRPGGFGRFDIWMSVDQGNNQWSLPVNAGRHINTKANELAPAVSNLQHTLFFASDGHPGYGGYDLFVATVSPASDTVLYNLKVPFNSVKDDCFITFNDQQIFWSSNRSGGVGGFDIYSASPISAPALVSKLSLKNRNDSRTVALTSRTAKSENIHLLASRNEERIDYSNLTNERKAVVKRMVENRLQHKENKREDFADLSLDQFESLKQIAHERLQDLVLKEKYASTLLSEIARTNHDHRASSITGEVIDAHKGSALRSARILLTNEFGDILKITSTNEHGQFRFTDVPPGIKLFLRLEKSSAETVNASVRNIQLMGSENKQAHDIENVYFDFDHYVIRPEAARVLTDLADYLKANPGAQVEIYAFADDRGTTAYNMELTRKRGESVVAFLAKNGVDATSFAVIPKGKQSLKYAANEIQRQYNRRAEFYINGVREMFAPSVKSYILKKEADWNLISRLTGIPKEELKRLNDSSGEVVKPLQPIRVPLNAKSIPEELFYVGI